LTRKLTSDLQIITERIELDSATIPPSKYPSKEAPSPANAPSYQLTVSYMRSTNAGKSLLAKGRTNASQPYSAFFDENGAMDQESFERWLGELVESTMDGKVA
jgi:signal peptidase complex subunit 2